MQNTIKINQVSIDAKVEDAVKKMERVSPDTIAQDFIATVQSYVQSSPVLGERAKVSLSGMSYTTTPVRDGVNKIRVLFTTDSYRPSLVPEVYGGINDIVLLLNDGVDHNMAPVYGKWHGKYTYSKTQILGTHFLENAVDEFLSKKQKEYRIQEIKINK